MVQYGVLKWAHHHPELVRYTDNIRQLEGLAHAGCIAPEEARILIDTYRTLRRTLHRLTLQGMPGHVTVTMFAAQRAPVQQLWNAWMEKSTDDHQP